jgi:hypothetical protein
VEKELLGFRVTLVWTDCDIECIMCVIEGFVWKRNCRDLGLLWCGQIVIVCG